MSSKGTVAILASLDSQVRYTLVREFLREIMASNRIPSGAHNIARNEYRMRIGAGDSRRRTRDTPRRIFQ